MFDLLPPRGRGLSRVGRWWKKLFRRCLLGLRTKHVAAARFLLPSFALQGEAECILVSLETCRACWDGGAQRCYDKVNIGCSIVLFRSSFIEMFYIWEIKYVNKVEYPQRKPHPAPTDGAYDLRVGRTGFGVRYSSKIMPAKVWGWPSSTSHQAACRRLYFTHFTCAFLLFSAIYFRIIF